MSATNRTLAHETSDEVLQKTMMEAHMRTEISSGDVDTHGSSFQRVPPEFKTMMWSIAGHFRSHLVESSPPLPNPCTGLFWVTTSHEQKREYFRVMCRPHWTHQTSCFSRGRCVSWLAFVAFLHVVQPSNGHLMLREGVGREG